MDNKEGIQPKEPSPRPSNLNGKPDFIIEMIAKRKGISFEEAEKQFDAMPIPKPLVKKAPDRLIEPEESFWTKKITRRQALGLGAAAAAGLAATAAITQAKNHWITNLWDWAIKNRDQKDQETNQNNITAVKKDIELKPDYGKLNRILDLVPDSKERIELELEYVKEASSLEQIDLGFYALNNWVMRAALLEKRYDLRKEGKYGLRKLTNQEITFAEKYKLHPEFVALCTDSYFEARSMLETKLDEVGREKFFALFRPDLVREVANGKLPQAVIDKLEIEDLLPNPGILIGIVWNESRAMFIGKPEDLPKGIKVQANMWNGTANIGTIPALKAINGSDAEDAKESLRKHIADLNKEAESKKIPPLKYNVDTIPASERSGDIGSVQFRPNTAWIFHQFLTKNFNYSLHPASLKAVTAACLYLASGFTWMDAATGKMQSKFGFINTKLKNLPLIEAVTKKLQAIQKDGTEKWNPSLLGSIVEWGVNYQKEIIDQGTFAQIHQDYIKKAI